MIVYKNCRICNRPLVFDCDTTDGLCSQSLRLRDDCYRKYYALSEGNEEFRHLVRMERSGDDPARYQALFDRYLEQNFTTENLKYDETGYPL